LILLVLTILVRIVQNLKRKANEMGFVLVEAAGQQSQNATW
jgi:hypothetical protein